MNLQRTDENQDIDKIHVVGDEVTLMDVTKTMTEAVGRTDLSSFIVCDLGRVVCKHREWTDAMPNIIPYYAVKCNDSWPVLKTLAMLGTGFDCASLTEIKQVLSLGVESDRIIFANSVKLPSHIRYARKHGVKKMTFDNVEELYKISELYPDAHLVLRIRCDDPTANLPLGSKFGCDPLAEACDLLQIAKKLNLNIVGVSFHVGSVCYNAEIFKTAIKLTKQVFLKGQAIGHNMYMVDIGGGFPGEKGTSIDKYATIINASIKKYFSDPRIKVISEPGTFFVCSASVLACMIYGKKKINIENSQTKEIKPRILYYLNDGIHGSFSIHNTQNTIRFPVSLKSMNKKVLISSSIFGPTCDAKDMLFDDILLPELNINEWLVFEDMGSYTFKAPQNFNGLPGPTYYYVANKSTCEILKNKCYQRSSLSFFRNKL